MLLSSVNFVAKPKAGKGKEKSEKKCEKKIEENEIASVCKKCMTEIEEENTIFRFPTSSCGSKNSFNTSGYASEDNFDFCQYPGERVTIATGDDLCLTVEQFFYTIGLRDESKSDSTCIFRKKVLESKPLPNGHVETVVFALDCDQEFYLTANKNKDLELNFFTANPSLEIPDERIFTVFFTDVGHCFIQPKLHKNAYLHHIDQSLSIQSLDLNWRCPEEYFFHFSAVPEPFVRTTPDVKICTHKTDNIDTDESSKNIETSVETTTHSLVKTINAELQRLNNRSEIPELIHKVPSKKKFKRKSVLSELLFGCFSSRSNKLTTTDCTECTDCTEV